LKLLYTITSHYFIHELNPSQQGFPETKSRVTDLAAYIYFIPPLVSSQRQVDSIYSDFVSRLILLHKLCVHGLPDGYVNWLGNHLTNLYAF